MIASLNPHVESRVISPSSPHEFSSRQILLSFCFVDVKYKEQQLFLHLRNYRQVNHLVSGTYRTSIRILLSLFRREIVINFGNICKGSVEHVICYLQRLFRKTNNLLIHLFELVLENRVILTDMQIV